MSLSSSLLRRLGWRTLMLQAAWNFERMQNLGFAFCVEPALRQLYPDPEARAKALKRHMELFNSHPYLAGYIVGAALKAEADATAKDAGPNQAQALKQAMAPALAALGDSFYWATLRPAVGMLAVVVSWLAPQPWNLAAPVALLLGFNIPSLWLRLDSVRVGWQQGPGVALYVARQRLPAIAEGLSMGALILVGCMVGALGRARHPSQGGGVPLIDNLLYLGAGLGLLLLLRLGLRPVSLLFLCVLSSLLLALAVP